MKRAMYSFVLMTCFACALPRPAAAQAYEPFLGEIQIFAYNFCPTGWIPADGATLPINQYAALFSLLGTTYGGNGTSNFQLPNWGQIVTANGGKLIACIAISGVFPSRN